MHTQTYAKMLMYSTRIWMHTQTYAKTRRCASGKDLQVIVRYTLNESGPAPWCSGAQRRKLGPGLRRPCAPAHSFGSVVRRRARGEDLQVIVRYTLN